MLEFGVGMITFALRDADEPVTASVWTEAVKASLLDMANVTELVVSEDGQEFSFVISIPRHLHRNVSASRLVSERYRVRTMSGYYSQFTFVAALDPSEPSDGSLGVRLVREQLAKQLADDPRIALHFVGPSPFHADFMLFPQNEYSDLDNIDVSQPFYGRVIADQGYDTAVFVYDPKVFSSDMEALDALQFDLASELSLFYAEVESRNERLSRGAEIREATEELIALHSTRGFLGPFKRLFLSGEKARALALAVMEAEFSIAAGRDSYNEAIEAIYGHSAGYFRKYTDRYGREDFAFFVDNGSKVVKLLEGGRTKELEMAVISGATLLGGLSGGIVSAIVAAPK